MRETISTNRRLFLAGSTSLAALTLAGCSASRPQATVEPGPVISAYYREMYGPMPFEQFPVPAVDLRQIDPRYYRQVVPDPTGERAGTIVVDTSARFLYLVQDNGQALRYGVGIGREGFAWSGTGEIAYKKKWPTWTPPAAMIERQPELEEYRNGQPPGLLNPLGARALYIFKNGRDTLYRLHGTSEAWSIGRAVSSGCVRLVHQDIIDLYSRVPVGTDIVVRA